MPLKHLTDDEIQDYLDGNLTQRDWVLAEKHLKTCPLCQEALKQYKALYVGLKHELGFELSQNFAKAVIRRLPAQEEAEPHFDFLNIFLIIFGALSSLGVALYYVNLKTLGKAFSNLLSFQQEFISGILEPIKNLYLGLNGSIGFLIFVGLSLAIIVALDHFLMKPKYKRLSL